MLLYIIKEKVCPHLAINHSVHPPQWQSEGAADWNIKHQCVRSECRQIKGQLHNVGERLLMNEVLACASFRAKTHSGTWCFYTDKQCFQPTEEKLETQKGKTSTCWFHLWYSLSELAVWEYLGFYEKCIGAFSWKSRANWISLTCSHQQTLNSHWNDSAFGFSLTRRLHDCSIRRYGDKR